MDFELSDDQVALRDAAASFLEGRCPIARVRDVSATRDRIDRDLWRAMADQGWLGIELPEELGGLGLAAVETAVLCEQLGRHLAPVPFLGTLLALGALHEAVDTGVLDAQEKIGPLEAARWIERLTTGEAVGAVAWAGSEPSLTATRTGDVGPWELSGRSETVVYGPVADLIVAFARHKGGLGVFAVATDDSKRPSAQPAMDVTRSLGWLELDRAPTCSLGEDGAYESLLDRAVTALCAEMLGAAARVLEMTVQYAKDRVQFGRPIGSFQAVKHRCADMLVDVEGMRSCAYYAAWAVGARDPEARSAASAAKVWCSDAASRVMASALQVHGGIGFTWEHDLHLFLKRSELDEVSFGGAVAHRERLVEILRPRAEAGLPIL